MEADLARNTSLTGEARAAIVGQLRIVLDRELDVEGAFSDDQWTSWGDIACWAEELERQFTEFGIARREPVVLALRNRPSALAALFGALAERRPSVLVSALHPPAYVRTVTAATDARVIVADEADCGSALLQQAGELDGGVVALPSAGQTAGQHRVRVARRPGSHHSDKPIGPEVAMLVPTSGTTGVPKLVHIGWEQLPPGSPGRPRPPRPPSVRPPIIHALSMATITGARGVLGAAMRGRGIAMLERVDVEAWSRLVERFGVRRAGLPPAAMRMMLDQRIPPARLASLDAWVTGSAPLDPVLQVEFEDYFGVPVLLAYGSTELGGPVATWTPELHREWSRRKLGSAGRASEGAELRVVSESTGEPLGPDDVGILTVRRRGDRSVGDRGGAWIRTSDRARIDSDGFVFIAGRVDDVIIRGGNKVSLGEVEEVFARHPAVRDAGAVDLADRRLGQVPAVAVVLRAGQSATPEELRAWARERLVPYKVPALIRIVAELPMGGSHKVNRGELRKILREVAGG